MGLVVEECFQQQSAAGPDSPSLNCDHPSTCPRRDSLVHITLRTLALLRRNQRLQYRLNLLQAETRAFVESVLAAPSSPSPSHWERLITRFSFPPSQLTPQYLIIYSLWHSTFFLFIIGYLYPGYVCNFRFKTKIVPGLLLNWHVEQKTTLDCDYNSN